MQARLNYTKKQLDDCVTIIDTIDPELKFKNYMDDFCFPKADGYDEIMNDFEMHLHKTKFRIKYGKYKLNFPRSNYHNEIFYLPYKIGVTSTKSF
jgi:hypothetical protein